MNTVENTPRREDEIPATQQQGNQNSSQQGQQNSQNQGQQGQENRNQGQQGQGYSESTQQGSNQNSSDQADQSSTYRGQGGQEYDVDASDAVNRQADYSGNSERDIEDSTLDDDTEFMGGQEVAIEEDTEDIEGNVGDRDIESQRDSNQNINPGDRAPNSNFNR
ncbi:hypothetical protein [Emticicia sp. C21]|uniref:hypothetical protein n=1 Tax=Emticicia sp. C21 TaxID=2302915 RepID=UPI000E3411B2|nr:hypothetical protein [Emticicia sp. C21]RFS17725.1 hypothetical protein D0T08_00275 [Emticicia sp. C21]